MKDIALHDGPASGCDPKRALYGDGKCIHWGKGRKKDTLGPKSEVRKALLNTILVTTA